MIKLFLIGLWVCGLTLGGVYAAVSFANAPANQEETEKAWQFVRGETISLPVVSNGAVGGYFLSRVSVAVDAEKAAAIHIPVASYVTDELYTLLVGDRLIDIANVGAFDVAALRTRIKDGINARAGNAIVKDVIVEQLDYLSKADLNASGSGRRAASIKIVEGQPAPPAAAASH